MAEERYSCNRETGLGVEAGLDPGVHGADADVALELQYLSPEACKTRAFRANLEWTDMRGVLKSAVLAATLAGAALIEPPRATAAAADGNWSVLIITEKGDCDPAYRYSVNVANGRISYSGEASVNMGGTVEPSGAVKVSIRLGEKGANGTGRLSGSTGAGTWRGAGPNASCSGRWEAEKR